MTRARLRWAPAAILGLGAVATLGVSAERALPLREPLGTAVPERIAGLDGSDQPVSAAERQVSGVGDYLFRIYDTPGGQGPLFTIYVGYYPSQRQGKSIHSPKNCLPGAGWEPLTSRQEMIATADGPVPVNQYLLRKGDEYALVLYWYQGRGRVVANEYSVKWYLLRDSAFRHRSDEALVRVLVPVTGSQESASELARKVAARLVPAVSQALPS